MTEISKENLLTGTSDFVGWYIKLQAQLEDKEYMNEGKIKTEYERKTFNFIVTRLSNSIAGKVSCSQTGTALVKFLKDNYSTGNAFELKSKYEEFKMMNHHTDAMKYLEIVHGLKAKAIHAGAKIHPRDEYKKLVNDVNPQFYLNYVREVRLKYKAQLESDAIKEEDIEAIREYFIAFYKSTPLIIKHQMRDEQSFKTGFVEKHCDHCQEKFGDRRCKGKKIQICKTHDTSECRSSNKEDIHAYFDTCASNHFVNRVPYNLNQTTTGNVSGSTGHSTKIIGSGEFKLGKSNIKASIAPGLDATLLSGGKLIKENYAVVLRKNLDGNKDLKIYQDNSNLNLQITGDVVATGHIDAKNMVKIDEPIQEVVMKTALSCGHTFADSTCTNCLQASRRRKNKSKSKGRKDYKTLEKVSIDTQGPFSVKGIDGSRYNLKIVDSKSKYITTILMPNKTSKTTADIFQHFIKRSERQTGYPLKTVATDGGTEFYGDFLDVLEKKGIQKIRGEDYEHSFPPDAENANRIINQYARKNLLYSKLPKYYWPFAITEGTYR